MMLKTKKTIAVALALTIMIIPSASAFQQVKNEENEGYSLSIFSHKCNVGFAISNYNNRSVNYTFAYVDLRAAIFDAIFANLRPEIIKKLRPSYFFENGIIPANGNVSKIYPVKFLRFSPVIAFIDVDNQSAMLSTLGFVFLRHVRFTFVGSQYINLINRFLVPSIQFVMDDNEDTLTVAAVDPSNILWSYMEIQGNCNTSQLGTYVTVGDTITECVDTITIRHTPTNTLLGSWTFT